MPECATPFTRSLETYGARVRPSLLHFLIHRERSQAVPSPGTVGYRIVIGTRVAHYEILRPIGSGGMGELYLAEDTKLGRRVALKFIAPDLTADPETRTRFLREARAASALDHVNVCAIYGIEETADGRSCIVMAYYEGMTLDRRLASGSLPVADAIAIAAQVAEGLDSAHALGIVHRDIKPANVMVTHDGVVKILDFGVAKVQGAPGLTVADAVVGTPGYMAPEQIVGGSADHRTDLWALGTLLYVMIAGRPPFEGEGLQGSIYAVLNRDPVSLSTRLPSVPGEVEAIVNRCLRKAPEERPGSAGEVAAALRGILRTMPASVGAPESTAATTRAALRLGDARDSASARRSPSPAPTRSRRWIPAAIGAVLLTSGVVLGGLLIARPHPLRIAVLPVEVEGIADSTEARLAVTATEAGLVRGLASLAGVSVADPAEIRGLRDPVAMRRAVAADDLIRTRLSASNDEWLVVVERLSGVDGSVRGARQFRAPQQPPSTLANALSVQLANEYPRRSRGGSTKLEISDRDYDEYVRLERAFRARDQGGMPPAEMVDRLEKLAERAPRFADAHLLRASFALNRYLTDRDPELLATARSAALRASTLAPDDPRPASLLFRSALAASELTEARKRLEDLKERNPGEVEVLRREAELADAEGRASNALSALRAAVARRDTRTLLQALAALEVKQGLVDDARVHLDTLIARFPDDRYPLSKLAQLELLYGDPGRSDSLYDELVVAAPGNVAYVANRGLARMLLARHAEAAEDFREALRIAPRNLSYIQNLADVYDLAGTRDSAAALYSLTLSRIRDGGLSNDPSMKLVSAQCLAHLGRRYEAVAAVQEALRTQSDQSEVLYTAALVYALTGDLSSARVNAERAREKGVGLRWFSLSWFQPLFTDAEFARRFAVPRSRSS
jgi:eukaryotic-like serine/threonine-protein kinase